MYQYKNVKVSKYAITSGSPVKYYLSKHTEVLSGKMYFKYQKQKYLYLLILIVNAHQRQAAFYCCGFNYLIN